MATTYDRTESTHPLPSPYIQVAGLVAGMALIALGNGLMATYMPVRLDQAGLGQREIGLVVVSVRARGVISAPSTV